MTIHSLRVTKYHQEKSFNLNGESSPDNRASVQQIKTNNIKVPEQLKISLLKRL